MPPIDEATLPGSLELVMVGRFSHQAHPATDLGLAARSRLVVRRRFEVPFARLFGEHIKPADAAYRGDGSQGGARWVFLDVDGTVLRGDSFVCILASGLRGAPWRGSLLLLVWPLLLAPVLGFDWRWLKSALLWTLTVGRGRRAAIRFLRGALQTRTEQLWRPEAGAAIARWRREGAQICYVSASAATWLRPLLQAHEAGPARIIGSRLRFWGGGVVIAGRDCRGPEKPRRIHDTLGADLEWVCAYGDSLADIPMLARAQRRVVVNPRPRHLAAFRRALGDCEVAVWSAREPAARPPLAGSGHEQGAR